MPGTCVECDRLLREYAESIHAHLESVRRSLSAAVHQNTAELMESERLENILILERHNLRRTLMEHEVDHLIHDLQLRNRQKTS
jgi:hypothetical protein